MSHKLNWERAKQRELPVRRLADENERMKDDRAARWLQKHDGQPDGRDPNHAPRLKPATKRDRRALKNRKRLKAQREKIFAADMAAYLDRSASCVIVRR
jgi:hypothetical protein